MKIETELNGPMDVVRNTKSEVLSEIKSKLEDITDEDEIDFHDIVSECVDRNCPQVNREALEFIEAYDHSEVIDDGVIDHSSINRLLVTTAYECLYQEMFEDDFIQTLQDKLNNETISTESSKEIINLITEYERENCLGAVVHVDSETQVWVSNKNIYPLCLSDFNGFFNMPSKQVIELSGDSFKIFTNNKEVNRNAIVLENVSSKEFRVYLMGKDKDLDIRKLFTVIPSSIKENDYRLVAKEYTEGVLKKEFKSRGEFVKLLAVIVNGDPNGLIFRE